MVVGSSGGTLPLVTAPPAATIAAAPLPAGPIGIKCGCDRGDDPTVAREARGEAPRRACTTSDAALVGKQDDRWNGTVAMPLLRAALLVLVLPLAAARGMLVDGRADNCGPTARNAAAVAIRTCGE